MDLLGQFIKMFLTSDMGKAILNRILQKVLGGLPAGVSASTADFTDEQIGGYVSEAVDEEVGGAPKSAMRAKKGK